MEWTRDHPPTWVSANAPTLDHGKVGTYHVEWFAATAGLSNHPVYRNGGVIGGNVTHQGHTVPYEVNPVPRVSLIGLPDLRHKKCGKVGGELILGFIASKESVLW